MSATIAKFTVDMKARMERAFALVCPAKHAAELADRGLLSREIAATVSWKDRIGAVLTDDMLEAADVTIGDVAEAIEFFTATSAQISREEIAALAWVSFPNGAPGFLVQAPGYRRGPAA